MAPPMTRLEQVQLDELLSDIYRGIETLPDKSRGSVTTTAYDISSVAPAHSSQQQASSQHLIDTTKTPPIYGRAYVREYELLESTPLVRQHKQELAALRGGAALETGGLAYAAASSAPTPDHNNRLQPARSTLKRHTAEQAQASQPQSLASFLTQPRASRPLATPEGKRRVRIVDPQAPTSGQSSGSHLGGSQRRAGIGASNDSNKRERVKYVNTNKFIYHQERDPDEFGQQEVEEEEEEELDYDETNEHLNASTSDANAHDDDDIDGVTRVEYYHTSWLDRQLGRASKRRSSKELNERQVKEKAMIEELKRSLKNGAITLRQSFKGKRNNSKQASASDAIFDDQLLNNNNNNYQLNHNHYPNKRVKDSSVIGSGLATLPRNYNHQKSSSKQQHQQQQKQQQRTENIKSNSTQAFDNIKLPTSINGQKLNWSKGIYHKEPIELNFDHTVATPKQTNAQTNNQPMSGNYPTPAVQQTTNYSSKTLPHNRQVPSSSFGANKHQLLQSHYRGQKNWTGIQAQKNYFNTLQPQSNLQLEHQQEMNHSAYNGASANKCASPIAHGVKGSTTPNSSQRLQQQQQQQQNVGNTISSIPSATEVVRSALSRSSSQISLNQLNKTINLLPNSPPPYAPSPMTPTQQLGAASPSRVTSPKCSTPRMQQNWLEARSPAHKQQQQQQQYQPGQLVLHGTRTIGRPPQQATPTPASCGQQYHQHQPHQQQQQPIYANPHASLMQHRMEQQMRQPNRNTNSIREFNELDSLLRSLSPTSTTSTTHITAGYTSKPGQPTIGGYMPSGQQPPQAANQSTRSNVSDIYARVQKPQEPHQQQQQYLASGLEKPATENLGPSFNQLEPYVVDVSDKKEDENCIQNQEYSKFEPPIDLLPSMEDYQNITKLSPVKNHYWYKPFMSRDKAISLLKDKPQGTFIVRDSTSHKGAFGLAVKVSKLPKNVLNNVSLRNTNGDPSAEYIRHFLIEPTGSGVRLSGYKDEPVFDNLPDLIYQHSLTQIALPCRLVIPRADIEDSRFNQKQKQFYDEFIISKEQAKHMPYERTSPDGGYRRYPGDVFVHNEHRIIFE